MSEDEKYLDDRVVLSNKGCPNYYAWFTKDGMKPLKKRCCPEDRCWYDEQQARRTEGKKAIGYDHWKVKIEGEK